jgi:hypothetical protein
LDKLSSTGGTMENSRSKWSVELKATWVPMGIKILVWNYWRRYKVCGAKGFG